MNKTVIAILALVSFSSIASASQLPMPPRHHTFTSTLETFDIDSSLSSLHNVIGGQISRDASRNELRLTLIRKSNCPVGAYCIAMVPAPLFITLPIVAVTKNAFGSITYTAKKDSRPVDGNLETLVLIDDGAGISLNWRTTTSGRQEGQSESFSSHFTGGALTQDRVLMTNIEEEFVAN